jgi:hypothetical protein
MRCSLASAILRTIAYADVFDYPLTASEIARYLEGVPCPPDRVRHTLDGDPLLAKRLGRSGEYFFLSDRQQIVDTRRARAAAAARVWPRAIRYGRTIARLPFVRMVAVSGALAVDNAHDHADIDYFIVTETGRLWVARAQTIALVRLVALKGDVICPNYFVANSTLTFSERNLFTAHEVAQMVPLSGREVYSLLRELNQWTTAFLPNAAGPPRAWWGAEVRPAWFQTLGERAGRTALAGRLECWEMSRKIRKFHAASLREPEAVFSADVCKGHVDGHGCRILAAFADRLVALDLA